MSRTAALAQAIAAAQTEALATGKTLIVAQQPSTGLFVTLVPGQDPKPAAKVFPTGRVERMPTRWELIRIEVEEMRTRRDGLTETLSELCGVYDEFTDTYSNDRDIPGVAELERESDALSQEIVKKLDLLRDNEPADSWLACKLEELQAKDSGALTFEWLFGHCYPYLDLADFLGGLHTYTAKDLAQRNRGAEGRAA